MRLPRSEILLRFAPLAAAALWCAVWARWPGPVELCGFHWLTGHPCPLCGLTRALAALALGRWAEALALNALSPLAAVLLVSAPALAAVPTVERRAWQFAVAAFSVFGLLRLA